MKKTGMERLMDFAKRYALQIVDKMEKEIVGVNVPLIIVEKKETRQLVVVGCFDNGKICLMQPIIGVPTIKTPDWMIKEYQAMNYLLDIRAEDMEELNALAQLFGLEVIYQNKNDLHFPFIRVKGDAGKEVVISKQREDFWATARIARVPMRFSGNGKWHYIIDI